MAQIDMVYKYMKENYKDNEPIMLSELRIPGMKEVSVRQQLKKLSEEGKIKRFDTGVYFLPRKSIFAFGSGISVESVLKKKYLEESGNRCGYIGGLNFANQLGITTQVPMVYEVYTNKATSEYRETSLANLRIILRKPYVKVDEGNASILQFLDLLKDITDISELEKEDLTEKLLGYMRTKQLAFESFKSFLSYYPERIYKNMYEVGLLNGVST